MQSGGALEISSELQQGTTITMLFPIATSNDLQQPEPAVQSGRAPGGTETLLVVEDEPRVRRFAVRALDSLGYRVLEAENAHQALELLGDGVDLLFSDMVMPGGMNGHELAGAAVKNHPQLKVLLTTGYSKDRTDPQPPEGEDSGSFPLLRKPYSKDQLAEQIRGLLDAKPS